LTQTIARPRAASRSRFATAPVLATAPDARTQIAREASDALTSGKSSIAESLCRTGLAIGPDAELERLLGVAVQQQGRSPEALACLTRALALASEGTRTWTESA
jgi:Flp pilus assembly protein TadD